MKRLSLYPIVYMVWIVVPLMLFGIYQLYGLPYVIWSYSWRETGPNSFMRFEHRNYTRCTFIGLKGVFTESAQNGACPWLRFARREDVRQWEAR